MRIATTKYSLAILDSIEQVYQKLNDCCLAATEANILLLPEYAGLEWVWPSPAQSFFEKLEHFQKASLPDYQTALRELAAAHQMIIIGGSVPVYDRHYYNRCYIAHPSGVLSFQDKIHLTPLEQSWLKGGKTLKVFNSDYGSFVVCICYDSEFPELTTQAVFAGGDVVLIPSYTDSPHGANRVQVAAKACAMENQCFAVTATCLGKVACDEFDGMAIGEAGIFSPIDQGFPEDGVLGLTQSGMVSAVIDTQQMAAIRSMGEVRNFHDRLSLASIIIQKENL